MELPSGKAPDSYQIYLDQFEEDPDGTLKKLEKHITKRNSGAVGYYILSVLSQKAGDNASAIKFALSAKILAPGSPFFNKLPYYIQHPESFDAWTPQAGEKKARKSERPSQFTRPIHDLDSLITKLSQVDSKRIRIPQKGDQSGNSKDLSESSANVDDIVTETLALIHEKQGNYSAAIKVYKQLRLANSSNRDKYDGEILRLQELAEGESAE